MRYTKKRSYVWSPDIAYSVGLMASDGCLSKDGRHLDLTSVDLEQLANFSSALGREFRIGSKKNGQGRLSYRVQFSDVGYYDFLLSTGLTPAKSKIMPALDIPLEYYADFLRGLFDGDGSTYMDPRWKSSYMYYVQYASASRQFIDYIQSTNSQLFGVTLGSVRPDGSVYLLSYAKANALKLYKAMYYRSDALSLTRKRTKLEGFILTDQSVTMGQVARVVELVDTYR